MVNVFNNPRSKTQSILKTAREIVCEKAGIAETDFLSKIRNKELSRPRQIYSYILYYHFRGLGISCTEIGRAIGRDHATVIHGARTTSEQMEIYPDFKKMVMEYVHEVEMFISPFIIDEDRIDYLKIKISETKIKLEMYEKELASLTAVGEREVA